ncbi:MAG: hypothetical protein SGI86_10290 [Deltaproteobacteria bacterium]|nr:hypothetical protein [Deltaproteobacteria bacterium]
MSGVVGGLLVGFLALLVGCLPDAREPEGQQILASRALVRVPLYAVDKKGPLFALASESAVVDRKGSWLNLHLHRPGAGLSPLLTDRSLTRISFAFGRLFVLLGERSSDGRSELDTETLGILDPGQDETQWISMHPRFQSLHVTATRYVLQSEDALVLGDAGGRTRKFGAASLVQVWENDRVYFRADAEMELFQSDALDSVPIPIAADVRAFAVDRFGHVLLVHESNGLVSVGADSRMNAVVAAAPGSCGFFVLLDAVSAALCAQFLPTHTQFMRVQLDTGNVFPVAELGPSESFFEVTLRDDRAAAYFHYSDQTMLVNGTGKVIRIPLLISSPLFTSDQKQVVYGAPASLQQSKFSPRLRIANADFSEAHEPVNDELLSRYLNYSIAEGASGRHLVFVGESGTGSTHLYTLRLGTPIGAARHLATGISSYELRGGRLLALVNLSSQDRTGSLVEYDLDRGSERLISAGVLDFSVGQPCDGCGLHPENQVAYLVRTRIPDPMEGLWVADLAPGVSFSDPPEPFAFRPPSSPSRSGVRPL